MCTVFCVHSGNAAFQLNACLTDASTTCRDVEWKCGYCLLEYLQLRENLIDLFLSLYLFFRHNLHCIEYVCCFVNTEHYLTWIEL